MTNQVKLGLGARNSNIRRYMVLQRFNKLGIGYIKDKERDNPTWSVQLRVQASKVRKENKVQIQKQIRYHVSNKKRTARPQNLRLKEQMAEAVIKCQEKAPVFALHKWCPQTTLHTDNPTQLYGSWLIQKRNVR